MRKITDIDINNKNVIIRFDYNVPIKNGKITDDTRIIKSLKTLNYCIERANRIVILSHLGRIKTEDDIKNNSLKVVCDYLSNLINKPITFCDYNMDSLPNAKIIMMENTRFFDLDNKKESNCDRGLSKYFSSFGEVFINDAFGVSHRENASNVGISKYLPSVNGFLIEEEVNNLNKLFEPDRPFLLIMGGSKVSDKIGVINNLITKVDKLLIGGKMVYTFLKANNYDISSDMYEDEYISYCKELLDNYKDKIVLIEDNYNEKKELIDIKDMTINDKGLDIGIKTVNKFKEEIEKSNTILFNGTLGLCEEGYTFGTIEILKSLNDNKGYIVVAGGDTVSAVNNLLGDNHFILSTGGGASLEYLEGKKLKGIFYEEEE